MYMNNLSHACEWGESQYFANLEQGPCCSLPNVHLNRVLNVWLFYRRLCYLQSQVSRKHKSKPDHITGSVDSLDNGFLPTRFYKTKSHLKNPVNLNVWPFLSIFCVLKTALSFKWPLVLQLQVWEEWLVPPDVERWGSLHWIRGVHAYTPID